MFAIIEQFINLGGLGTIAFILIRSQIKYNESSTKERAEQNKFFIEQMSLITASIKTMANNVGKTLLTTQQTAVVFKSVFNEHIIKKLNWTRSVLENNDIRTRKVEIKRNIKSTYQEEVRIAIENLSEFNTPAGDIGLILNNAINWKDYMRDVYEIFFSNSTIALKYRDLNHLMRGLSTDILIIIEDKARKNIL